MRIGGLKRWRDPKTWTEAAYDPAVRGAALQVLLLAVLALLAYEIVTSGFNFALLPGRNKTSTDRSEIQGKHLSLY